MTEVVAKSSGSLEGVGETDDDDFLFKYPKRNLAEEFGKSWHQEHVGDEHMKVYLRIRPFTQNEVENKEDKACLEVENLHSVLTHAPRSSHSFKNCAHGLGKTTNKFTFSKIFQEDVSQKEFFNEAMLGLVKDFIDGQNCLVFTYGVTSSGKTYTVQGEPRDAGILPRTLDVLFNSISGKQWERLNLKPKMFTDVTKLRLEEEETEKKRKEDTLKLSNLEDQDVMSLLGDDASDISQASTATNLTVSSDSSYAMLKDTLEGELENRVREEAAVSVTEQGQIRFSVWVSFAEIYNEQIFDLLQPVPKKRTARRQVLKLSEDINGSPYIKGLKEICVFSADEAYKLLTIGQRNLQTACTKLNHQSSRSHCIFNIKVIRVVDKGDPNMARVSMLSLCDLAGSERQSKTFSTGNRLKEAGNINTSLMTLGRCIEMLRNKQHNRDNPKVIPFRDSKLTRIFQNFFCGQGKANMIVNVNKCASMFDETLHVLKFSAVASQVIIQKPAPKVMVPPVKVTTAAQPARLPSIAWATPGQERAMHTRSDTAAAISLPDDEDDDLEENDLKSTVSELAQIVEELEDKLREERKARMYDEIRIREEVCNEMMKQLVEVEYEHSERERQIEIDAEERMEQRIQFLMDGMKSVPRKKRKLSSFPSALEEDMGPSSVSNQEDTESQAAKVQELTVMLEEAGETFREKEEEIAQLKNDLKKEREAVSMLKKSLIESKEACERAEETIFQLNERLLTVETERDSLKEEVNTHSSRVGCLEEKLRKKDETIDSLQLKVEEELRKKDETMREKDETMREKDETISSLKLKVTREEKESLQREQALINGYKSEMVQMKKQIHNLEEAMKRKDKQSVELNDELNKMRVSKEMLEADLQDYQNDYNMLKELKDTNIQLKQRVEEMKNSDNGVMDDLRQQVASLVKQSEENSESLQVKETELKQCCVQIKDLEDKLHQREKDIDNLKKICDDEHMCSINRLKEQINKLQSESEMLTSDICAKNLEVESLQKDVDHLSKHMGEKIQKQTERGTALEDQRKICIEQQQKFEVFKASLGSQIAALQREVAEKTSLIQKIEEANNKLQEEVNTFKKENSEDFRMDRTRLVSSQVTNDRLVGKAVPKKEENDVEMQESSVKEKTEIVHDLHEREELQQLQECLSENKTHIEELKETISSKEKLLEEITEKLSLSEGVVEELTDKLSKTEGVVKELREILSKKESRVEELSEKLSGKESTVQELTETLSQKESKVQELKETFSEREGSLHELKEKLSQKESMVQELSEKLSERGSTIQELSEKLSDKEITVREITEKLSQKENMVQELSEKLSEMEGEEEELEGRLCDSECALRENEEKLTKSEEVLCEKTQNLERLEEVNKELKQKVEKAENDVKAERQQRENVLKGYQELEEKWKDSCNLLQLEEEKTQHLQSELNELKKSVVNSGHDSKEANEETVKLLKKQLKDASDVISELNQKICDLEDKVVKASQSLEMQKESQTQDGKSTSRASFLPGAERDKLQEQLSQCWETINDLQQQIQKKDLRLQEESSHVQQLLEKIETDRRNYETAMTDAGANEALISHLREALTEQEETMSKLDMVMQQQDVEISRLKQDLEKYMGQCKDLLSNTNTSSREIRELSMQNARVTAEKERLLQQLDQKVEENKSLTAVKEESLTSLRADIEKSDDRVKDLENRLKKSDDKVKDLEKQLEKSADKVKDLEKQLEKSDDRVRDLEKQLEKSADKVKNMESTDDKVKNLEKQLQTVTKEKGKLELIITENNKELKELEKCVSETRLECETLKVEQNTIIQEKLTAERTEFEAKIAELKEKIRAKDQNARESLRLKESEMKKWKEEKDELVASLEKIISSQKAATEKMKHLESENTGLKSQIKDQTETIKKFTLATEKMKQIESENTAFKSEIGDQVETIRQLTAVSEKMKQVESENTALKSQINDQIETIRQLTESPAPSTGRSTRRRNTSARKTRGTEADASYLSEQLDTTNQNLDITTPVAGKNLRRKNSSSVDPSRTSAKKSRNTESDVSIMSDHIDTTNHLQIDATPPVAAKKLRRRKKNRSSIDINREIKVERQSIQDGSTRARHKDSVNSPGRLGSAITAIKKSFSSLGKKPLEEIKEMSPQRNVRSPVMEVMDSGTQMSAEKAKESKRRRKQHHLYNAENQISEPFNSAVFVEARNSEEDAHSIVKRKLRGRKN